VEDRSTQKKKKGVEKKKGIGVKRKEGAPGSPGRKGTGRELTTSSIMGSSATSGEKRRKGEGGPSRASRHREGGKRKKHVLDRGKTLRNTFNPKKYGKKRHIGDRPGKKKGGSVFESKKVMKLDETRGKNPWKGGRTFASRASASQKGVSHRQRSKGRNRGMWNVCPLSSYSKEEGPCVSKNLNLERGKRNCVAL